MRTLGVVTGSRADYSIYRPLLRTVRAELSLDLKLFVTGMHLSPEFGESVRDIEKEGWDTSLRVPIPLASDSPAGIAESMGQCVSGFSRLYGSVSPDMLVVLGDRFEMHAASLAALPFKIPIAHIHGGEVTSGAIDDALRHSMTKLSHLHFVSTEQYARRLIRILHHAGNGPRADRAAGERQPVDPGRNGRC